VSATCAEYCQGIKAYFSEEDQASKAVQLAIECVAAGAITSASDLTGEEFQGALEFLGKQTEEQQYLILQGLVMLIISHSAAEGRDVSQAQAFKRLVSDNQSYALKLHRLRYMVKMQFVLNQVKAAIPSELYQVLSSMVIPFIYQKFTTENRDQAPALIYQTLIARIKDQEPLAYSPSQYAVFKKTVENVWKMLCQPSVLGGLLSNLSPEDKVSLETTAGSLADILKIIDQLSQKTPIQRKTPSSSSSTPFLYSGQNGNGSMAELSAKPL
jgi:hypothetical protein